jgi:hypothetical protein
MRASQTIDGSMTGKKFLAYVERCLAPTLKRKHIVMIDNLPAHKAAGIREAIEARGAMLRYLPKYSPDLNLKPSPTSGRVSMEMHTRTLPAERAGLRGVSWKFACVRPHSRTPSASSQPFRAKFE